MRKVKAGPVAKVADKDLPEDPLARLEAAGMLLQRPTARLEDLSSPTALKCGVSISKLLDDQGQDRI